MCGMEADYLSTQYKYYPQIDVFHHHRIQCMIKHVYKLLLGALHFQFDLQQHNVSALF